jgi:hypothetical protein
MNSPAARPHHSLPTETALLGGAPALSLLAGPAGSVLTHKTPKREWTRRMVALTRDFHIFAACVTTRFSAEFFSNWHIA